EEYLYLTRGYHSLHKLPYFANAFFGINNITSHVGYLSGGECREYPFCYASTPLGEVEFSSSLTLKKEM
ncbi:MAG: hypothetical protein ACP5MB_09140, partial [bacterium]